MNDGFSITNHSNFSILQLVKTKIKDIKSKDDFNTIIYLIKTLFLDINAEKNLDLKKFTNNIIIKYIFETDFNYKNEFIQKLIEFDNMYYFLYINNKIRENDINKELLDIINLYINDEKFEDFKKEMLKFKIIVLSMLDFINNENEINKCKNLIINGDIND